jgi:hypothetical protein
MFCHTGQTLGLPLGFRKWGAMILAAASYPTAKGFNSPALHHLSIPDGESRTWEVCMSIYNHRNGNDSQVYENQADLPDAYERERWGKPSAGQRLTKAEAKRISRQIRELVPAALRQQEARGSLVGVTSDAVADTLSCKPNFARTILLLMVKDNELERKKGGGSIKDLFFLPEQVSKQENALDEHLDDVETKDVIGEIFGGDALPAEPSADNDKGDKHSPKQTVSSEPENNILVAIQEIDNKIEQIRAKIARDQRKVDDLERAKVHLLEGEMN